jgi:diacylglycerol kinase (ATP)
MVRPSSSISYGGGMRICPDADMTDGKFQITVVGAVGRVELLRVLPRAYSGRHVEHPSVTTYEASMVTLSAPKVSAWADGERITALPVTATAVPGALRLLAPHVPSPRINVITSEDVAR